MGRNTRTRRARWRRIWALIRTPAYTDLATASEREFDRDRVDEWLALMARAIDERDHERRIGNALGLWHEYQPAGLLCVCGKHADHSSHNPPLRAVS